MIAGLASSNKIVCRHLLSHCGLYREIAVPLYWEHQQEIGEVVFLRRSATGIYIRARLYQAANDAWSAIDYGRARGLSVRTNG